MNPISKTLLERVENAISPYDATELRYNYVKPPEVRMINTIGKITCMYSLPLNFGCSTRKKCQCYYATQINDSWIRIDPPFRVLYVCDNIL